MVNKIWFSNLQVLVFEVMHKHLLWAVGFFKFSKNFLTSNNSKEKKLPGESYSPWSSEVGSRICGQQSGALLYLCTQIYPWLTKNACAGCCSILKIGDGKKSHKGIRREEFGPIPAICAQLRDSHPES